LSPRTNIGLQLAGKLRRRKLTKENSGERESHGDVHVICDIKLDDNRDPALIVCVTHEGQTDFALIGVHNSI